LQSDLTVACVLRSGGIYDATWVSRLQRGVARHLGLPHRFVCLSDVEVPCERIPLMNRWPGWWSKLELFRPGIFGGRVLYLDLDTVVVGSLDAIASHPHHFTMAHEYYRPEQFCSTAMAWDGSCDFGIMAAFNLDLIPRYTKRERIGDQAFIEETLQTRGVPIDTFRDLFGEHSVSSYKVHECAKGPPAGAVVVAFHGKPKPHQITSGWVPSAWQ
jgi:hypothetical protein